MKKIILISCLVFGAAGTSFAQQPKTATTDKKPASSKSATTASSATSAKPTTTSAGPTKANGTPDMRYKTNKEAAKNPQPAHVKKDGTPDMRYKENKKAS